MQEIFEAMGHLIDGIEYLLNGGLESEKIKEV